MSFLLCLVDTRFSGNKNAPFNRPSPEKRPSSQRSVWLVDHVGIGSFRRTSTPTSCPPVCSVETDRHLSHRVGLKPMQLHPTTRCTFVDGTDGFRHRRPSRRRVHGRVANAPCECGRIVVCDASFALPSSSVSGVLDATVPFAIHLWHDRRWHSHVGLGCVGQLGTCSFGSARLTHHGIFPGFLGKNARALPSTPSARTQTPGALYVRTVHRTAFVRSTRLRWRTTSRRCLRPSAWSCFVVTFSAWPVASSLGVHRASPSGGFQLLLPVLPRIVSSNQRPMSTVWGVFLLSDTAPVPPVWWGEPPIGPGDLPIGGGFQRRPGSV